MRWNRTSMAVLMSVICWCAPLMGAQEEPSCGQWNTEEFFETATAKDVAACLADGTGVGVRGESGITPLHWAAFGNQNPAVIQALLAAGADPMARPESGFTPLHLAAQNNENVAVIQVLLAAGADAMMRAESGITPLHLAANSNQNPAVIQALLVGGADAMARTESGITPLHWAADNDSPYYVSTYQRKYCSSAATRMF